MIIKSMSRKVPSFVQLYDYITQANDYDPAFVYSWNHLKQDREAILQEFERNAELLVKRKNGNYLYHEIISITRSTSLPEQRQRALLYHLADEYVQTRAKDCLVFGGMHVDKESNLHFHLMISANRVSESRRYRLTQKQFADSKKGLEHYVLEQHPELEQAKLITQDKSRGKTSNKEQALKRRTKKPTQKDIVKGKLSYIFSVASTRQEFKALFADMQLEYYIRGKTAGVLDLANGRKHRIKTLGLESQYLALLDSFERQQPAQDQQTADRKARWKKQHDADAKVKRRDEQGTAENLQETAKEWIQGDFSKRDARHRNEQFETTKQEWNMTKKKDEAVKERSQQSTYQNAKEISKEWVFGDFSNRDARARKNEAKDATQKRAEQSHETEKEKAKRRKGDWTTIITGPRTEIRISTGTADHRFEWYWAELCRMSKTFCVVAGDVVISPHAHLICGLR